MRLSDLVRVGHCCVMCVLVCICEQCVIFRYEHPHIVEHGGYIEQGSIEEIERMDKKEKKVYKYKYANILRNRNRITFLAFYIGPSLKSTLRLIATNGNLRLGLPKTDTRFVGEVLQERMVLERIISRDSAEM